MNPVIDKRGFSLLELLIAICLLSIGMMALATLQSRGIRGNDLANRTTQAIALAQDKLEELVNTSTSTTLAAGSTNDPNNPVDETGSNGGVFTRSWDVHACDRRSNHSHYSDLERYYRATQCDREWCYYV
jgi:prepilin-type N-terminal cleavage/methylation domain-containing protein